MLTTVEKLITARNLRPKKKEGFLKIISIFSFLGIMLGVATLIIVMSVMNGFRTELTDKILGFNSHITIKPYSSNINEEFYSKLREEYKDFNIIKTLNGEAVVIKSNLAKGILIRGIESKKINDLNFFKKNIIDGKLSSFKEGTIKGLLGMGSFIMTASLFASPLLGIIIGLVVLIVVKRQLKKIEVSEIYDWFRDQIKKHGKTLATLGGGAGIAVMMGAI